MTIFKKAILNINRQPLKSVILFLIVFILANIISGTLTINRAVYNTESNLRRKFPPVAVITQSDEATLDLWSIDDFENFEPQEFPSIEDFKNIGALPYVKHFDFFLPVTLYSNALERSWNIFNEDLGIHYSGDFGNLEEVEPGLRRFESRGIFRTDFIDLELGRIGIVDGRNFTSDELQSNTPKALISTELARINHISVGEFYHLR